MMTEVVMRVRAKMGYGCMMCKMTDADAVPVMRRMVAVAAGQGKEKRMVRGTWVQSPRNWSCESRSRCHCVHSRIQTGTRRHMFPNAFHPF